MPVPTRSELDQRSQKSTERIQELQDAYAEFLRVWKQVEENHRTKLAELNKYIDKSKIHDLLHQIDTLKD